MKVKSLLSLFIAIAMSGRLQAQGLGGLIQRTAASAGNAVIDKARMDAGHNNNQQNQQSQV